MIFKTKKAFKNYGFFFVSPSSASHSSSLMSTKQIQFGESTVKMNVTNSTISRLYIFSFFMYSYDAEQQEKKHQSKKKKNTLFLNEGGSQPGLNCGRISIFKQI